MGQYLSSTNFDFKGKTVLLRIDTDVDTVAEDRGGGRLKVDEDFRLKAVIPTIEFLESLGAGKIILMGHLGRPEGKVVKKLSLEPVAQKLAELISSKFKVQSSKLQLKVQNFEGFEISENIFLLENLRFNKGEEENDESFAKELSDLGDVYVNEAFGASHREHASIVGIPKFLPSFLGLRFEGEIRVLDDLRKKTKRPLVFVLGGSKEDKLSYLSFLSKWCDRVLVGGKLPQQFKIQSSKCKVTVQSSKLIFGNLKENGRDIDEGTIEDFKGFIKDAKTLVWAGPMGVYEELENQKGTFEIAKAIAQGEAFKVAGGGDTHRVLSMLNLWDKFDFVSVAGGAMLYFLKEKTLPGIEVIEKI